MIYLNSVCEPAVSRPTDRLMIAGPLVLGVSFGYLLLLFAIAAFADRRAASGGSVIDNAWVYALSLAVYCTAWTYFGSVGRAAASGVWFLPIYLGPDAGDAAGGGRRWCAR